MILKELDNKTAIYDYCCINSNINYIYIPVPKNASIYMNRILHYIWDFSNIKISEISENIFNNSKKILILRDPIDRWITGASHYLYRVGYNDNPNLVMGELFEKISFDAHTSSQTERLSGLNLYNTTYFYYNNFDKDPLKKIKKYLHKILGGSVSNHTVEKYNLYMNSISEIQLRAEYKKAIVHYINENPNLVDKLKDFFKEDYNLINSVKFYD